MAGVELRDAVFVEEATESLAGGGHGGQVGEDEQVARAEGVAAEAVAGGLVDEGGGAGRVAGREDYLNLAVAEVKDLSVSEIELFALIVGHEHGRVDLVGSVDPDAVPFVDTRAGMVGVDVCGNEHHGLLADVLGNLLQAGDYRAGVEQNCRRVALDEVH